MRRSKSKWPKARLGLQKIHEKLEALNSTRARSLEFIRESDSLEKYKSLSRELADLQGEMAVLEAKRAAATRLAELRRQQRVLTEEYGHLETAVETQIEQISQDEEGRFGRLRRYFTEIIYEVLGQNAIIAIKMNRQGGLDFTAEFIGSAGIATSGDKGTSYRKLLCIAFDLALLRTYLDVPFPRFVYHDGALDSLSQGSAKSSSVYSDSIRRWDYSQSFRCSTATYLFPSGLVLRL